MKHQKHTIHTIAAKLAQNGILLALAAAFSFLESLVPLPYGIRLGLSGIITLYGIFILTPADAAAILLLKSLFVFITRGFSAGLLSLSGGMLSLFGMLLLAKLGASLLMTSSMGGLLHNLGQMLTAMLLTGSGGLVFLLPILTISGILAGSITAWIFHLLLQRLPEPFLTVQSSRHKTMKGST